jgi:hypothetical protein
MTSMFGEAARALFERELSCPKCQAHNAPGQPHPIEVEDNGHFDSAGCSQCGLFGPIGMFQRPTRAKQGA